MDIKKIMDMVLGSGGETAGFGLGGGCAVGRDVGQGEKCHS